MKGQDFDKSAARVTVLVWSMAALTVLLIGVVFTNVVLSRGRVEHTYQQTEEARTQVDESLLKLRVYCGKLMADLNDVTTAAADASVDLELLNTDTPTEFDRDMVSDRCQLVTQSVINLGADEAVVRASMDAFYSGIEDMYSSFQDAWQQTRAARQTLRQCELAEIEARAAVQTMSEVISKSVGKQRLQTAVGLSRIRRASEADRVDRLEEFADEQSRSSQPQQLLNDMADLVLQTELLARMDDVDRLRSQKDNIIRQILQRLSRNYTRVGADAEKFARHLQDYQAHLFGRGFQDDPQHQRMVTTEDGLYSLKVKYLQQQEALRLSRDNADAAARTCHTAEAQVDALVTQLYGEVSQRMLEQTSQASDSLLGVVSAAVIGFLVACGWIVRVLSRTMTQAKEQQKASAEMARIIRDSPDEVYIADCETLRFLSVNRGACEATGYAEKELLALSPFELNAAVGPVEFEEMVQPLLSREVPYLEFQTKHRRKDGEVYPARMSLHTAMYGGQKVFVAFVIDISMVQQLEQRLSKAQKLESVGQLAAGVAHEINTPMQFVTDNIAFVGDYWGSILSAIDTCESLLTSEEPVAWEERRTLVDEMLSDRRFSHARREIGTALEECADGCERVVQIVRAMKEFSHPGNVEKTTASVNDLVESTLTIARNRWKHNATVELDLDPSVPVVPMLVSEMNQVLLNLVVNATDAIVERFEGQDDVLGQIVIRTYHKEEFVVIEVEDNGNGIPEAIRAKVFDPFFTTKDVGKGTGQGLAISQNVIVNQHGGEIDVRSKPGEGTTFILRIPVQDAGVLELVSQSSQELEPVAV